MGTLGYNNDTGYVKVYHTNDNGRNRTQLSKTIYGNAANDGFGHFVDITANGMTIICGSLWTVPGCVRVFSLVDGDDNLGMATWEQIG
jgi:hypothetical protein